MSLELAIVAAPLGLMWFYYKAAIHFGDSRDHWPLGLFLYLMSFVMSWLVLAVTVNLVDNAGTLGGAVSNNLDLMWLAAIVAGAMTMVYFVLRTMVQPMLDARKRKRFEL